MKKYLPRHHSLDRQSLPRHERPECLAMQGSVVVAVAVAVEVAMAGTVLLEACQTSRQVLPVGLGIEIRFRTRVNMKT